MNVTVFGAGAWGTAIAVHAASLQPTLLWARDAGQAMEMKALRCNSRYLGKVALPSTLPITADADVALAHAASGLAIIATPMSALDEMLHLVASRAPHVLWLCKGFEAGSGRLGNEIAKAVGGRAKVGVLSGPSFALEVALSQPTALVVASHDDALNNATVEALHGAALRIYTSNDPIGVEVGGAMKNVLAIATGIADGMHLGLNARAALVTRGLAEMTRLGVALGGRAETFMGLSGLGDLVLTATGDLSRNRKVGIGLGEGRSLAEIMATLGHVAEGVLCAPMVRRRARDAGVEVPISEAVVQVLEGTVSADAALQHLMGRGPRSEV